MIRSADIVLILVLMFKLYRQRGIYPRLLLYQTITSLGTELEYERIVRLLEIYLTWLAANLRDL